MSIAVEVDEITRVFEPRRRRGNRVVALDEVSLTIPEGEIHGLLGPNGAGKTTLVKILSTVLLPTSGRARVLGHDVVEETKAVRPLIGIVFGGERGLYTRLTGRQNLEYWGALYKLSAAETRSRAEDLIRRVGLEERANQRAEEYSHGMKQRLHLARGLMGDAKVLFLDEPTTGLDIRSRIGLWDTIEELVAGGTTVLLTTQDLDEADRLTDRIAVIDQGVVIAEGTSDELKKQVGGDRLEIRLDDRDRGEAALAALSAIADGGPLIENGTLRVPLARRKGEIAEAVRRLDEAGIGIEDIAVGRPTLDDVFLKLTGHAAEEDGEGTGPEVAKEARR
mgnify:CR=1 FL=1